MINKSLPINIRNQSSKKNLFLILTYKHYLYKIYQKASTQLGS